MAERARRIALGGLIAALSACGAATSGDEPSQPPATHLAAVTALIDAVNRGAAGPVDPQQTALVAAVHPDDAAAQRACPPATVTVRLLPVWTELRPDPQWRPSGAAASDPPHGTVYRLPVLAEVYTAGLRTGTDMTLLRLAVVDGSAKLFALCLN